MHICYHLLLMVSKGKTVELTIDSAAFEGSAVGRVDDFVVFVRNGVPGDRVRVLVKRKRKRHAEGVVEEILEPSPHRVEPRCPYFETCGGCTWQNYEYSQQLVSKRRQVIDLLERIGGLEVPKVAETIPSPKPYCYRNKMEFTFGSSRWLTKEEIESGEQLSRDFALGLHIPKRFDKILDLEECHLQSEESAAIVNHVRGIALREGWSARDSRAHEGYLRNLSIRIGARTQEILVNLVTSEAHPARMRMLCDELQEAFPQVTTFINSVNSTRSPVAAGEETVYCGEGSIRDRIGAYTFKIGAQTFFQPNTLQAEQLFQCVRNWAGLTGAEKVFDVYCGVGAISLFVSQGAAEVIGFDSQEQAIEDARGNALQNGVENCRFFARDAREALRPGVFREIGRPHVIILDPPRVGLHKDVCRDLRESMTPRVVYISCNPATQARDLQLLSDRYRIVAVQPVDMFPQTYHIENVVLLESR